MLRGFTRGFLSFLFTVHFKAGYVIFKPVIIQKEYSEGKEGFMMKAMVKKAVIGIMAGMMAFSVPVVINTAVKTDSVMAARVGTYEKPKQLLFNTVYLNKHYGDSEDDYSDYYYFRTDNSDAEYTLYVGDVDCNDVLIDIWYKEQGEWVSTFDGYVSGWQTFDVFELSGLKKNREYMLLVKNISRSYRLILEHKVKGNEVKNYNGRWTYYNSLGRPDYTFSGIARTTGGAWVYVEKGVFDTSWTGLARSVSNNWYYVKRGRYDTSYTGLAKAKSGQWYHVKNGKYDSAYTGISKAPSGKWYYVKNGRYDKTYNGLAPAESGRLYYVKNGKLDRSFSGECFYKGKYYTVRNGVV